METSPFSRHSLQMHSPSGAGEAQPSEPATQPSEQPDSGSPPQQAVLESWFRNLTEARKRLLETQPAETSKPAAEPAASPAQTQPAVVKAARKQPPVKREGVIISPCSFRAYFDDHGALPDDLTDLDGMPLSLNAAFSLALTVAGNLASPPLQPPPAKPASKSWANITEEEHQDRNDEREHREDGRAISAHFVKAGQAAQQAAAPGRQSAEEAAAMEQALRESAAEHQANTHPAE